MEAVNATETLYALRDGLMSESGLGQHYRALYEQNSPRIAYLLLRDNALRSEFGRVLQQVTPGLKYLVGSAEDEEIVTQEMIDALRGFLRRLAQADETLGTTGLVSTLAVESDSVPWENLVGLTFAEAWDYLNMSTSGAQSVRR